AGYDWGGALPASSPRCGPSAYSAWSPPMATIFTTSPGRLNRRRRSRSTGSGINTTFTPNGGARDCRPIGASFVGCCGGYGRPIGGLLVRPHRPPPPPPPLPLLFGPCCAPTPPPSPTPPGVPALARAA